MGQLFNLENPIWQGMSRVADIMILSLLWIVCSIPIVTIGASNTALYYVTLKIAEKREGYLVKGFFKSFKENFRQATIIWLLLLLFFIVTTVDIRFFSQIEGTAGTVASVVIYALMFIGLIVNIYIFPILARFSNTIKRTFLNTMVMAFANPGYLIWSIAMVVVVVAAVYYFPMVLIFAPGILGYLLAMPISRVIGKYMPKEEEEDSEAKGLE